MLVYISLWILFQLLIEINCQISPDKRRRHTATLVDNKLYILGGSEINKVGKDFFYIDFSVPFNTRNLLLTDLSKVNIVPPHFGAGSAKGGANNDTLFICGGVDDVNLKMEDVYTFDPKSNSWSIPKINGDAPPVLVSASTTVIDQKGKMYLWAGIGSNVPILDTINLVWTKGSSVGAPNVGLLASATTLLPNNKIIYLEDTNNDNISQVYIYDPVNDNWTTKATSGTIPPKKSGMSVILDMYLNKQYYKGSGYTTENDILLLDISNVNEYIWTNEFKPSSSISISVKTTSVPVLPPPTLPPLPPSSPSTSSQKSKNNNSNITGAIIGPLFGGALLSFVGALLYRWNKNRNKNFYRNNNNNNNININGNENNYNNIQAGRINYYPGQEIIQPPAPTSLINDNMNINGNESNYNNIQAQRINYYPGQEIIQPPAPTSLINDNMNINGNESIYNNNNIRAERFNYYPGQEIIQPPASATVINMSPNANDEIQGLKQEIRDLRQIILQNNKQTTNSMGNN
ncbi:hypothetical protein RhiirA5_397441 [Rhizophagus irregularis]|uniref:Galactose oxidase n=1 Tax=Rhizophagus irregularis TaxID=588596 RepID=A0A2N0RRL5_9GLOM|nr:hypothetical protein RhiirA5_397441 [Rhizophagus irregularis]PKC65956.1 hypothetical protein RhiirA1_441983 [Rhizophagus irregularis]